jgi:hypothetical protein
MQDPEVEIRTLRGALADVLAALDEVERQTLGYLAMRGDGLTPASVAYHAPRVEAARAILGLSGLGREDVAGKTEGAIDVSTRLAPAIREVLEAVEENRYSAGFSSREDLNAYTTLKHGRAIVPCAPTDRRVNGFVLTDLGRQLLEHDRRIEQQGGRAE